MSRNRGRERNRLVDELRRDIAADAADRANDVAPTNWHEQPERPAPELVPCRLLDVNDIGCIVSVRTDVNGTTRDQTKNTIGRLVGIRPASGSASGARELVIQQGTTQAAFRTPPGEPVTVRRQP